MKQQPVTPTAPLYPELPAADSLLPAADSDTQVITQDSDQSYRLQQICQLKRQLENEREKRSSLYKKYKRGVNTVNGVDTALVTVSVGMGVGGVGLLTTIIAAPVVLGLEIAALACGLLGVAGKFVSRLLLVKAQKHDEIRVLADSKLNTISDHVSTALIDGEISDQKFRLSDSGRGVQVQPNEG